MSLQILVFAAFFAFSGHNANAQDADAGDVETGLIGHWTLDDASGSQITDSSSNANHGTWIDNENTDLTEESGVGKIRSSIMLDADDRITIPTIGAYNVGTTGSFSISFWFKTFDPAITFLSAGAGNQIISMGLDGGRVRFRMRDSLGNSLFFPYSCAYGCRDDGQWHLAVMVLDRVNNSAHVYIDDIEEQSFSDVSAVTGNMGAIVNITTNGASSGLELDDIRYYNRALSFDDVALLYKSFPGQVTCDATHEAVMIFNHKEKVMQYCNGTDWVNVGERNEPCPAGYTSCGGNPDERLVFVTSTTTNAGNSASALCQNLADAAGLKGTYLPWYSTSTTDVASTFEHSTVPYVKTNGVKVADDWTDLTDGNIDSPINVYETNTNYTGFVVSTRTNTDGTYLGPDYVAGNGYQNSSTWTNNTTVGGSVGSRRYCFEQGPIVSTGCTAPNGKAGEMDYNLEDGVMQYCDGENWISMGPKSAEAGVSADDLSTTAPTNGLIGHWPLNTNANDALGSSNGSLQNGAAIITSNKKFGAGAVELDGTNDHVRVPTTSNINLAGASEMSVSLWVDLDSVSGTVNSLLLWEAVNGGNNSEPYRLNVWDAGGGQYFPSFELANASDTTIRLDAGNLNYNGWHHVVGTYDGAEMRIYVDGQLANSAAQTGVIKTPNDGALNVDLLIGSGEISTARYTNGSIDDVRLYNRKLEPEEVLALYRASSLVAHWKLDETTGTVAADSSGNGYDLNIRNTDFDADSVAGKNNRALKIRGNSGQFCAQNTANVTNLMSSAITISGWFTIDDLTRLNRIISFQNQSYSVGFSVPVGQQQLGFTVDTTDSGGSLLQTIGNININAGEWHHFAATYDGATMAIYLDGQLSNSRAKSGTPDTSTSFNLGSDGLTCNSATMEGNLDDVRIYNRALSAAEIGLLYAATGGGSIPISGCSNIGDVCDDGSIYAGLSPDGDIHMYTTLADLSGTFTWNDATTNWLDTPLVNCSNQEEECLKGSSNTEFLATADSATTTAGVEPHNAALACYCLGESHASAPNANIPSICAADPAGTNATNGFGHDDWYLPSLAEMDTMYFNLVSPDDADNPTWSDGAGGGDGSSGSLAGPQAGTFGGTFYWTSSEQFSFNAWRLNVSNGEHSPVGKNAAYSVRCARRGATIIGGTCANPNGIAGEIVYNDDYNIMQYCNGSEWVALGSDYSGSAVVLSPPAGTGDCPNIGDVCPDGSVYAGFSPDGNIRMFTTPADGNDGNVIPWNNNSTDYTDVSAMDRCEDGPPGSNAACQTGAANTASIILEDSDSVMSGIQEHEAAQYCADLTAHGKNDWYLPAQDELYILYTNSGSIGGFHTTASAQNHYYWTSNEKTANVANAIRINFTDGSITNPSKNGDYSIRCVRKDAASTGSDSTPDAFDFTDRANLAVNSTYQTQILTLTGIDAPTAISISGTGSPEFQINNTGSWLTSGTIFPEQTLQLRAVTASTASTTTTFTVVVGGVSDSVNFTTVSSGGPADCPIIGNTCADGSIFLGLYDYGSGDEPVFITDIYTNSPTQWKTSNGADDIATNNTDGRLNVSQMSPITNFTAANHCETLSLHGHSDWYLMSFDEAELFTIAKPAIPSINGNKHWTSTEANNNEAVVVLPNADYAVSSRNEFKDSLQTLRCIRR